MIGSLKVNNIVLFFVAVAVGVLMSYTNAHAGIVADMFEEPVADLTAIVTEDLGNTLALVGVFAAIVIAFWQQSLLMGIVMVGAIGVIWSTMEQFA